MELSSEEVLLMLTSTTLVFGLFYWIYSQYFINNIGIEEHFIRCTLRYTTQCSKLATTVDSKTAEAWLLVLVALQRVYKEEKILSLYELNSRTRQKLIKEMHDTEPYDSLYESYLIALNHLKFWYESVSNIMKGHFLGTSFKVNVYRVYKVLKTTI